MDNLSIIPSDLIIIINCIYFPNVVDFFWGFHSPDLLVWLIMGYTENSKAELHSFVQNDGSHLPKHKEKKQKPFYFRDTSKTRTFSSEVDYVNYGISSTLRWVSEYTVKFVVLCYKKETATVNWKSMQRANTVLWERVPRSEIAAGKATSLSDWCTCAWA